MYAHREVYANAPLALVAAEMRFSYAPRLRDENTRDQIQEALEDVLPIRRQPASFVIQVGSPGLEPPPDPGMLLLDRASTTSATITTQAVSIETTDYSEYDKFRGMASRVLSAVGTLAKVPAVERLGLRYVDEVRVPDKITDAKQWSKWVNNKLVQPLDVFDGSTPGYQGVALIERGQDRYVEARWAALDAASTIGSDPLRRAVPPPGPFFLLDFDSYWSASEPIDAREFELNSTLALLDDLHDPIGSTFQNSLTIKARRLFRGESID